VSAGGKDTGPNPYELLLMSLGACTSMTLRLYARRKQLPLTRVSVRLRHARIHAELEGQLDAQQRQRLLEIANMCPVHRTLIGEISIVTKLAS
jgi:putative redox protein